MKTILNYILSVILAIVLIAVFFINLVCNTVLNEEYVLSKLEKENYYAKIYEQEEENFENYIYQSGLDETVLKNIVTMDKVKKDTKIIIGNIYKGTKQDIDIEEIRDNLNKNIQNSLSTTNITSSQRKAIDTYIDEICNEYKTTISYFSSNTKIGDEFAKIVKFMSLVKNILLIVMGIDFLLLLVLNLKGFYKFISFSGMSFTICGLTLVFFNIFVNSRIKIKTITILNDVISEVLRNILSEELKLIINYGIISIFIGVFLIIISNLLHNFKERNKLNKREKIEGE